MNDTKQQYHYFITSFDVWTRGNDLFQTLMTHKKRTASATADVWRVPRVVPADGGETYGVNWYQPIVNGAELIDVVIVKEKEANEDIREDVRRIRLNIAQGGMQIVATPEDEEAGEILKRAV